MDEELICLRPKYTFPAFDISLQQEAFATSGEFVYLEPRAVRIDEDGKQWFHPSLAAPRIVDYLVSDVSNYWRIVERRVADYKKVRQLVESSCEQGRLSDTIESLCAAYILALRSVVIANLAVEDVYARLERLVKTLLPLQQANRYLANIISCPAARRAAELGFFEDTRGTKRIADVKSAPVCIFADPVIFVPSEIDGMLTGLALAHGIPLAEFWGLRVVAPLTVQFCEEFRYADYSIRTHLKAALSDAGAYLDLPERELYGLPYKEVVQSISSA